MLSWLFKPKASPGCVGIELQAEGVALVSTFMQGEQKVANRVAYLLGQSDAERFSALTEYVAAHNLRRTPCNLVLQPGSYQLFLLEAPEVPDADLADALKWRIKDLANLPVEKIALEVFFLPKDIARGSKKMVYAAVVNRDYLEQVIRGLQATGLHLLAVDIAELSLRNLAVALVEPAYDTRGVAIVRIKRGSGSVCVFRAGNLYLSRQFDLNYKGGLLDALPDETLALELQRSLDYCERQLGQPAPSVIYIAGENIYEDKLTPLLRNNLPSPVQHLEISAALSLHKPVDSGLLQVCLVAAGAALRKEVDHAVH